MEELSLTELLEHIGGGLLTSEYRQDRIFIQYDEPCNIDMMFNYLVGQACTYEPFVGTELTLTGGKGHDPVMELRVALKGKEGHIYSVKIEGDWTTEQLDHLSLQAGALWPYQILFWIRKVDWIKYAPHWFNLMQTSRHYHLRPQFTLREIIVDPPELIEPSDVERAEWPDTTRAYVEALEFYYDKLEAK